jgi:hypothetical protein
MQQPPGKPSQESAYQVGHGYQAAAQGKMVMKSEYAVNNVDRGNLDSDLKK